MMQFGANTFIWVSPFSTAAHLSLVDKVAGMGFDVFEIDVEDPDLIDVPVLKERLAAHGLRPIVCGVFGPNRDLASLNPAYRENAAVYIRRLVDMAAELGSPVVGGPMYSAVGKSHLASVAEREAEWQRAVVGLQAAAAYAGERGVRLALEPLNRFETDMVNVVEQGLALIADVDSPHVGLHLDTFHMHLEEKDSAAAIRHAGDRLFHFHACENDRGVPGTGQVKWYDVAEALQDIGYSAAVAIESFTPEVSSIARAVCIWREIAPSQDAIAADGLAFLETLFPSEGQ